MWTARLTFLPLAMGGHGWKRRETYLRPTQPSPRFQGAARGTAHDTMNGERDVVPAGVGDADAADHREAPTGTFRRSPETNDGAVEHGPASGVLNSSA